MSENPNITPVAPNGAITAVPDANAPSQRIGAPRFQELLERLQKIASEQPQADQVDSPEGLRDALRTADDGFVAAMDLRKQLEEAFRRHMQ